MFSDVLQTFLKVCFYLTKMARKFTFYFLGFCNYCFVCSGFLFRVQCFSRRSSTFRVNFFINLQLKCLKTFWKIFFLFYLKISYLLLCVLCRFMQQKHKRNCQNLESRIPTEKRRYLPFCIVNRAH